MKNKVLDKQGSKLVVVKSNQVISSSYKLTLNEQRIVLACIAKIDSMKELTKEDGITIRVDEIKDLLVVSDMNIKGFYGELKKATEKLYNRSIILDNDGSKRRWVYEVKYNKHQGDITLFFSPSIIPYLSELKGNFTKYKLEHIAHFKSVHSIRIYELLCQWAFMGRKEIEITELKMMLGLDGKYARSTNFVNRVIIVAVDEINEHSNISVAYGLRKTGRQITHIQFMFDVKKEPRKKTLEENLQNQQKNIMNFVRDNPTKTKGKSEQEVRKMMRLKPEIT
ncbi:replication initiation protein [Candidatus Woesearchaeota archaeon]|jgi:plasmid replication initiation protein|nr:replication initiation protein [Candidatus Woesearchaeota archaeon]